MSDTRAATIIAAKQLRIIQGTYYHNEKPLRLQRWYNAYFVEVMAGGHVVWLPAGALAWYIHFWEWPRGAVRHFDGNPLNFHKNNLKVNCQRTPRARIKRKLTEEEEQNYVGVRSAVQI